MMAARAAGRKRTRRGLADHSLDDGPISAWPATEAKSGDLLTVATHADWLRGMRIAGVGIMLAGIAPALFTITGLMRFMARRVSEVAIQAIETDS